MDISVNISEHLIRKSLLETIFQNKTSEKAIKTCCIWYKVYNKLVTAIKALMLEHSG